MKTNISDNIMQRNRNAVNRNEYRRGVIYIYCFSFLFMSNISNNMADEYYGAGMKIHLFMWL